MTDEQQTWRADFWKVVHNYVSACGGDIFGSDVTANPDTASLKLAAVREIEACLIQSPGIDAQLRLDLLAYKLRANAAILAAVNLVDIAAHMANGEVTLERQEEARAALSKVNEALAQLATHAN